MARRKSKYSPPPKRARKLKGRRSISGWTVGVVVIVVVGVLLIVVSKGEEDKVAAKGIQIGDHWHAAIGFDVCGDWVGDSTPTEGDIHTHGDGLVHLEPRSSASTGDRATLGNYFKQAGWKLSADSIKAWDGKRHESGKDKCGGKAAELRWRHNGKERTGNPADVVLNDGDRIVLAFLPPGADLPDEPPSIAELAHPSDVEGGGQPSTPLPTTPTGTPTSIPSGSTETTAAGGQ